VAPDGSTGDTFTITTDSLGRFLLSANTGSILLLGGALAGYTTPDAQAFTIGDGTSVTGAVLRYQRDGFIRGTLVDSAGDPVYSIVYVNAPNGDSHYGYSDPITGAYVVESPVFPDGRSFTVQALQLDGYVSPATRTVTLTIPQQSLSGVDFTYGNALVVGSVVDGASHPLAGVPIFVEGASGGKEGFSDANGNYRLPAQVGQATIHPLRFAGFATPDVVTVGPLAAGQVANIAPFVYRPLGSVSGITVDQQGQRLANVIVAVTDGLANYYTAYTDALGQFSMPAAPGTNSVYVRGIFGYNSPAALSNVVVSSGLETGGLLLQFLNPVLAGQVVDSHGNAVAGVTVTASGALYNQAVTDNNGGFTIKLGLGSSTLTVPDLVGYDTPDPLDVTYLTTGNVGPVTITYGKFTTVIGSQLRVTVFDQDTHAPLDGVTTLLQVDADHSIQRTTAGGDVKFSVDPGTYVLYVFKDGYRPLTTQVTAGIGAPTNQVFLSHQDFIQGTVNVRRLTLAEILAAGIDVTAADNQNIYEFQAHIQLCVTCVATPVVIPITSTGSPVIRRTPPPPSPIQSIGCTALSGCGYFITGGAAGGGGGGYIYIKGLPGPAAAKPFAYLVIPGEARFLKEFFDINFHVVNTADPAFVLHGVSATLTIPAGLSLALTGAAQLLSHDLGDIPGGTDASTDWIVRGDTEGDYTPIVDLHVNDLLPFSATPVDRSFQPSKPMHVFGGSAVKLRLPGPRLRGRGQPDRLQLQPRRGRRRRQRERLPVRRQGRAPEPDRLPRLPTQRQPLRPGQRPDPAEPARHLRAALAVREPARQHAARRHRNLADLHPGPEQLQHLRQRFRDPHRGLPPADPARIRGDPEARLGPDRPAHHELGRLCALHTDRRSGRPLRVERHGKRGKHGCRGPDEQQPRLRDPGRRVQPGAALDAPADSHRFPLRGAPRLGHGAQRAQLPDLPLDRPLHLEPAGRPDRRGGGRRRQRADLPGRLDLPGPLLLRDRDRPAARRRDARGRDAHAAPDHRDQLPGWLQPCRGPPPGRLRPPPVHRRQAGRRDRPERGDAGPLQQPRPRLGRPQRRRHLPGDGELGRRRTVPLQPLGQRHLRQRPLRAAGQRHPQHHARRNP